MKRDEKGAAAARAFMERLNFSRPAGTPAERQAAGILLKEAEKYADAVRLEPFTCRLEKGDMYTELSSANVHAVLSGMGRQQDFVLLCAHYDSVPEGPGAYDNLASCAVMMTLLSYFQKHRPVRNLHVVFCGAEERGLLGSQAFVRCHKSLLSGCIFCINSDLAGQDGGPDVFGVTAGEEVVRFLQNALQKENLTAVLKREVWASDSNSFAAAGIPAVTYDRDGYGMHTKEDTLDRITVSALADAMQLVGTAAERTLNDPCLPFPKDMPEDMREGLTAYFAEKNSGLTWMNP